jgi:hypothetical protein
MENLLFLSITAFCVCEFFFMFFRMNNDFSLNGVNQLIVVMVKYGVLFEVRTGFLNII